MFPCALACVASRFYGCAIFRRRIVELPLIEQDVAEDDMAVGQLWINCKGPMNLAERCIVVAQFAQSVAQIGVHIRAVRIEHGGLAVLPGRCFGRMLLVQHETQTLNGCLLCPVRV